jgi:hypothetical protein
MVTDSCAAAPHHQDAYPVCIRHVHLLALNEPVGSQQGSCAPCLNVGGSWTPRKEDSTVFDASLTRRHPVRSSFDTL